VNGLKVPMREELRTVEDLQEVVNKLRSEMETLLEASWGSVWFIPRSSEGQAARTFHVPTVNHSCRLCKVFVFSAKRKPLATHSNVAGTDKC